MQTPIVSQITFRESKEKAYSSISSSPKSVIHECLSIFIFIILNISRHLYDYESMS